MPDLPPGVRRHGAGYQAIVKYRGERTYLMFPLAATPAEMALAIEHAHAELVLRRGARPDPGTFAADAERYLALAAVKAMPSFMDRKKHILEWVAVFGRRRRATIREDEIEDHLKGLEATGQYSGSSLNKRRTALMALYTKLDGRAGRNPVKNVPKFPEREAEPRGLPRELQVMLLRMIKPGTIRLRLQIIRWCGIPQKQLGLITRERLDYAGATVRVPRRKKGKGVKARVLPLLPRAVRAFQALERRDGLGAFKVAALRITLWRARNRLLRRVATEKVRLSPQSLAWLAREDRFDRIRPYDLRHSFGAFLRRHTPDMKARQALMLHGDVRQTERYEMEAADEAVQDALRRVVERMRGKAGAASIPASAGARTGAKGD